jgi:hypothetical protein
MSTEVRECTGVTNHIFLRNICRKVPGVTRERTYVVNELQQSQFNQSIRSSVHEGTQIMTCRLVMYHLMVIQNYTNRNRVFRYASNTNTQVINYLSFFSYKGRSEFCITHTVHVLTINTSTDKCN